MNRLIEVMSLVQHSEIVPATYTSKGLASTRRHPAGIGATGIGPRYSARGENDRKGNLSMDFVPRGCRGWFRFELRDFTNTLDLSTLP